jgi:ABC-type phosphate transport system substrate-binding protein
MNFKKNVRRIAAWMALPVVLFAMPCHAGEVIAHPSVSLSADEVKETFLGDKQLSGATKLVPVDNAAEQGDFTTKVLGMDATKYGARWTKKAFREGLTAPAVKGSDAEVVAFVKATPGAVGYVSGTASGVKVLMKY